VVSEEWEWIPAVLQLKAKMRRYTGDSGRSEAQA
jgi:hypothetical protein